MQQVEVARQQRDLIVYMCVYTHVCKPVSAKPGNHKITRQKVFQKTPAMVTKGQERTRETDRETGREEGERETDRRERDGAAGKATLLWERGRLMFGEFQAVLFCVY